MSHRPATIERDIHHFLISPVMERGVRIHGGERGLVIVLMIRSQFSKNSIRMRPVRQEPKKMMSTRGSPLPVRSGYRKETP
jgi:hypothetical protein